MVANFNCSPYLNDLANYNSSYINCTKEFTGIISKRVSDRQDLNFCFRRDLPFVSFAYKLERNYYNDTRV